mgnify:CR=1 FL=1
MADPTASLTISAGSGMILLGVATGLDPVLLIAGLAGGFASYLFMDPQPWPRRLLGASFAGLAGGWGSPVAAATLAGFGWWPTGITASQVAPLLALVGGLLTIPVLAPQSIAIARRRVEEVAK